MSTRLVSVLTVLCALQQLSAQELYIRTVDTTNFPRLSASVHVASYADRSSIILIDDGQVRPLHTVRCPDSTQRPVSIGLMVDTKEFLDVVRSASHDLVSFLSLPPSDIGITAMAGGVQIVQECTTSKQALHAAIDRIPKAPGIDLHTMFYDSVAGGIPFISAARNTERVLILLSDMHCPQLNVDEARVAADCRAAGIKVFTVLLGTVDVTGLFRRLALATGGDVLENVTDNVSLHRALLDVVLRVTSAPCSVEWTSAASCSQAALVEMLVGHEHAQHAYVRPDRGIITTTIAPAAIRFSASSREEVVTVSVDRGTCTISDVHVNDTTFSVEPRSAIVTSDHPARFTIRRGDTSSTYHVAQCTFLANACTRSCVLTSGTFGIGSTALRLVAPNGAERFAVGSDTTIYWTGVQDTQRVLVDLSKDGGHTWSELARAARGGALRWTSIVGPASDHCLMRVRTYTSAFDTIRTPRMSSSAHSGISALHVQGDRVYASEDFRTMHALDTDGLSLLASTTEAATIEGLPDMIRCADVDADGHTVLTVHGDHAARLWDAPSMTVRAVLSGHNSMVRCAEFSPLGQHVLTTSDDATALIFDARTGERIQRITPHTERITHAAWRPDGRYVATCSTDGTFAVFDAVSGRIAWQQHLEAQPTRCAWSPDGLLLAIGTARNVQVWSMADRQLRAQLENGNNEVLLLRWNATADRLITASATQAEIWDVTRMSRIGNVLTSATLFTAAQFLPDGSSLALASRTDVRIVDVADARTLLTFDAAVAAGITCMDVHPVRGTVYTGGMDGRVHAWTVPSLRPLQEDVSDAEWSITAPSAEVVVHDVDCGSVRVNASKDTTIHAVICNRGTAPLHIRHVALAGEASAEFAIVNGGGTTTVLPGACADIRVAFMPMAEGRRPASLAFDTDAADGSIIVQLHGVGIVDHLHIASRDVDVGIVRCGRSKDTLVHALVQNTGDAPLHLAAPLLHGASPHLFMYDGPRQGFVIAPGAVCDVTVRYTPTSTGKSTALLTFSVQGSDVSVSVRLIGTGRSNETMNVPTSASDHDDRTFTAPGSPHLHARISCGTAEAAPGENVSIVVRLQTVDGAIADRAMPIHVTLRFNASMLVPIEDTPHGTLDGNDRCIRYTFPASTETTTTRTFQFRATLGTDTTTPLQLSDAVSDDGSVMIDLVDGRFRTTSICKALGPRLFDPLQPSEPPHVWPNPVRTTGTVTVATDSCVGLRAVVLDLGGAELMDLGDPVWQGGVAAWHIPPSSLAAGMYVASIITPRSARSIPFIVSE